MKPKKKNLKIKIKARLRKSKLDLKKTLFKSNVKSKILTGKKNIKKNLKNFFEWIKGAEIISLKSCEKYLKKKNILLQNKGNRLLIKIYRNHLVFHKYRQNSH